MQIVYVDHPDGDPDRRKLGRIVARRPKTREIFVLVDDNPSADDWYPVTMWTVQDAR